jgi:arylsulfatase A-like enzyme
MKRPNVLFFFTDDQRYDTIAALGNPHIKTPNMDALVARGTCFTHAHIPGGTSGAVCMPSRAMLHTGRTLFHIEGAGQSIPTDHTTMGENFGNCGYRTFGTGKWHNGRASFARSFTDGAEIFFGGMTDHWNVPAYDYDPSGRYDAKCPLVADPFHSKEETLRDCSHIIAGKHSSELLAEGAIDFLRRYDGEDPYFMYISFLAPHDPRVMPQEYRDMYDPDEVELPPNFAIQHPFDLGVMQIRDEVLADYPRKPPQVREHIADYYAMITHLDAQLGRVLEAVEARGETDNTIVVFAGDNGLAIGRHGLFGKQNLYDHSVRVPLIFAGPGVPQGVRTDAYAYLLDIFPTLCELTGCPRPESVEGESLVAAMGDSTEKVRDELYLAYERLHRGIRTRTHKLIECQVAGVRHTQLFDLEKDPHEVEDLAGNPRQADKVAALRARLAAQRDAWDDRQSEWGEAFWSGVEY